MIVEYLEHIMKCFKHVDALLILNNENIIEYSAYFSREKNKFVADDFIGSNIFDIYPGLTPETSVNCHVRQTGVPIIEQPVTNCDYKNRIFHFISSTFPLFINGEIIGTVEFSVYDNMKYLQEQNCTLPSLYHLDDFITQDPALEKLKNNIRRIAPTNSSVLVCGETGTGKEIIAQTIAAHSMRASNPFVTVNCSAIPATLMESTLFGTVKGSFTGAVDRKGLFETARGGTLFLDELNSMDILLQAKLLRAIESGEIYRVGSSKSIPIDVRVVAAMNTPPAQAILENKLRPDLFYRLSVAQINIPPLRERKGDIPLLSGAFIHHYNEKTGKHITALDRQVSRRFQAYNWPGNVRELKNCIEYAFMVCEDEIIHLQDLPESYLEKFEAKERQAPSISISLKEKTEQFERKEIGEALKFSRNLVEVANILGISRQTLQYKMKKYGLK